MADVLAAGPMALAVSLRCASDIASTLRGMHEQGRAHGKVLAASVMMMPGGAELLTARGGRGQGDVVGDVERDIRQFGALLFEMLTGAPPRAGQLPVTARLPGPRSGPAGLRASALEIAVSCLGEAKSQPTMQQAVTEIRLLAVLLKMQDKEDSPAEPAPSASPAPFLVTPAPPPVREESNRWIMQATPQPAPAADPETADIEQEPDVESGTRADLRDFGGERGNTPVVGLGLGSFGQPSAKDPPEVAKAGGPCPKCECSTVYISRARSNFENLLVQLKVPICRCHRCYHRYFVFASLKFGKEMPVGAQRRRRLHRR